MKRLPSFLIGAAVGAALVFVLLRPVAPVPEPPAPAIDLPSGGLVIERTAPPAELPRVAEEAAAAVKGEVARVGHAVIQPTVKDSLTADGICLCMPEPIKVNWALIDVADGQRFGLEVDGGELLEASDSPVRGTVRSRAVPRWHVHAFVNPADREEFIVEAGRSFGRWTVGAALVGIDGKAVPMVGGGVRF